ncbi:MAG: hypothetical protein N4A65_16190 [Cohaesibacter sp.]|jgi:hypothetical protein|nr:hypothetical protein [Cohaesibacter sp.]
MSAQAVTEAQNIANASAEDLLEKQYHNIGIQSVAAAACCVSKPKASKKKADYRTLSEEIMTD